MAVITISEQGETVSSQAKDDVGPPQSEKISVHNQHNETASRASLLSNENARLK